MNLHEYQAKQLLAAAAVPITEGAPASSVEETLIVARRLGGESWIIKAQVHAGGRGKAGGVRRVHSLAEVENAASALLGSRLVTVQTPPQGLPVHSVLVERPCAIARELYLALTVERSRERVIMIASGTGGMDIEQLAAKDAAVAPGILPPATLAHPYAAQIHSAEIHPVAGLQAYQCRDIGFALDLGDKQIAQFTKIALALYRLFLEKDASLIEINPLIVTGAGELLALDAKITLDDNALYRHPDLGVLRDETQEDVRENSARQFGLNYISLDGDIACMVNGAGLAMATMDLIKLHGGAPANFLDVGGGTTADKVAEAFKLILSDGKVKAILVNIFGGIVRCDLIAEGIIKAVSEVGITLPVIVRLEGNNAERARELLRISNLKIIAASDLTDAAIKAVASVK
ncbi:MAG: ADP-forming succinate--CoA ligase subunit beta [Gammaproteobacteria bacterium]|nr:ADP-forming succinate--CoA ligase subunit beta [Gammaproteobacteria bacterium]